MDVPVPLGPTDPAPVPPRSSARAWILIRLLISLSLALVLAHSRQERPGLDLQADPVRLGRQEGLAFQRLAFYIRQNTRPAGRVLLRLAVKAGSFDETDDQQGLAHFLEHMAFNGSKHFAPGGKSSMYSGSSNAVYALTCGPSRAPTDSKYEIARAEPTCGRS